MALVYQPVGCDASRDALGVDEVIKPRTPTHHVMHWEFSATSIFNYGYPRTIDSHGRTIHMNRLHWINYPLKGNMG